MKKKLFFVFIFSFLICTLFFAEVAFAADFAITSGTGTGYIDLSSYSDGDILHIQTTQVVELRNGGNKDIQIICEVSGVNLVLNNVSIASSNDGIRLEGAASDNITLRGSNYIEAGNSCAGIRVASDNTLHINGTGALDVYGDYFAPGIGNNPDDNIDSGRIIIDSGTINAYGGEYAAGIGSAADNGDGYVTINGGTVNAHGGIYGAGIGGGDCASGYVTITGGTITSYGGECGAGIGGGYDGNGYVEISNSTINAYGGLYAAGIGGGDYGNGQVTINSGTIHAEGGEAASFGTGGTGIGGGENGVGNVRINNGNITAVGKYGSAGIGSGSGYDAEGTIVSYDAHVDIYGGTITATGGEYAAGIGSGDYCGKAFINIYGGTITAAGGEWGAGIGGGGDGGSGVINIHGGTITATGGEFGAGLGSGIADDSYGNLVGSSSVNIENATIYATGGDWAAGIGGGFEAEGYVQIENCSVEATAGYSAAGIGGGEWANGYITILSSTITATGGELIYVSGVNKTFSGGAGIGGGELGDGTVTITESNITAIAGTGAAGIGGGDAGDGDVTITGGTITATGGGSYNDFGNPDEGRFYFGGAGIGGGEEGAATVIINSGIVTATGGDSAAGIGSGIGYYNISSVPVTCDATVTINGGTITATGGDSAAGIGGGDFGGSGYITITGGTITATGGEWAAGIGSGYGDDIAGNIAAEGQVSIENAIVYAQGGDWGAGIGGGIDAKGTVDIENSTVEARGGYGAAGIGGGDYADGDVTIYSGDIKAYGGSGADYDGSWYDGGAGIGAGEEASASVIIYGGTILAEGGYDSAGIGSGSKSDKGFVRIDDGTIYATGGYDAAAIGGGVLSTCDIDINGGRIETYTIEGSEAGIGCGYGNSQDFTIDISGGLIIARGGSEFGESAAAIGGGYDSTGTITIAMSGGQIYAIGAGTNCDDIGAGSNNSATVDVTISGTSSVFVLNDRVALADGYGSFTYLPHVYVNSETVTSNEAYGFTEFPNEWNTHTGYGYLVPVSVYFNHNWDVTPTVDTVAAYAGAYLDEPAAPVREGYVFNGWHLDTAGENPFYFDSMMAYDGLTLYADWVEEGTFRGNISGTLSSNSGSPINGAALTLQSSPVTVTTNSSGSFAFGSSFYINHTLIVRDASGNVLKTYHMTFTEGAAAGSTVDEVAGTIDIVYTPAVTGVNIPLRVDASGFTANVNGVITFTMAGTDPATGRAINPNTGDREMKGFVYGAIALMGAAATAGIALSRKKRKQAGSANQQAA
ncbi:MAG: InlB B-repeat-containing protein [Clostridia bacterium]|nr:InlB B-repeat-containing protein [Clostridia bacterium]